MDKDLTIEEILFELEVAGLEPYVYYEAATGSVYIKFREERLRSLRIADHPGRSKYRYKWNLRKDIAGACEENDNGVVRYYYPFEDLVSLVYHMRSYLMAIKVGED